MVSAGTSVTIAVEWDTGEESSIFIEKSNEERGENLVDSVECFGPIDKSNGEDGGDSGG